MLKIVENDISHIHSDIDNKQVIGKVINKKNVQDQVLVNSVLGTDTLLLQNQQKVDKRSKAYRETIGRIGKSKIQPVNNLELEVTNQNQQKVDKRSKLYRESIKRVVDGHLNPDFIKPIKFLKIDKRSKAYRDSIMIPVKHVVLVNSKSSIKKIGIDSSKVSQSVLKKHLSDSKQINCRIIVTLRLDEMMKLDKMAVEQNRTISNMSHTIISNVLRTFV